MTTIGTKDRVNARRTPVELLADRTSERFERFKKLLRQCQARSSEGAVHDLRVAARRLLAAVDLLESSVPDTRLKKSRLKLKALIKMFNPLRDVQVQRLYVEESLSRFPQMAPYLTLLKLKEQRLMKRLHRDITSFRTGSLGKTLMRTKARFEESLARSQAQSATIVILSGVVARRFTVSLHLVSCLDVNDPGTIHTLRLSFKKFRYTAEMLNGIVPGFSGELLDSMQAYQQRMGAIQDIGVLMKGLHRFSSSRSNPDPGALREVEHELGTMRSGLIRSFINDADALIGLWRPGLPTTTILTHN